MKPTAQLFGPLLAALAMTALADDTPAKPAAPVAPPVTVATAPDQFLVPGLPKFSPPPPVEVQPVNAPNPDVLELPKMVIRQKPRPRLTPEIMMTKKGFGEELAKQKLSDFDRNFLNKFTLPLFGVSAEERALEEYRREKKEQLTSDVLNMAKALELTDPAEAKSLKEAATKP